MALDGGDVSEGSGQQHGAAVNHGLAAPRACNDPAAHDDAGKRPQSALSTSRCCPHPSECPAAIRKQNFSRLVLQMQEEAAVISHLSVWVHCPPGHELPQSKSCELLLERAFCLCACEEFAWILPRPLYFVNFLS